MDASDEADRAFRRRDYALALKLSEKLAGEGDPSAIYTCGLIYEIGAGLPGPDLAKAWVNFERLAREYGLSEGYLGCVRILIANRDRAKARIAESFCRSAIEADGTAFGYLLLGDVCLRLKQPPDLAMAESSYISSAIRGSVWGMRRYARLMRIRGNWLGCLLMHTIATVLTPIYLIIFGFRSTRSG